MAIDVVAPRHRVVCLPADEVQSFMPERGFLSLDLKRARSRANRRPPRLSAVLVAEGEPIRMLGPLNYARVTKIKWTAQLIIGVHRKEQPERHPHDCRQA